MNSRPPSRLVAVSLEEMEKVDEAEFAINLRIGKRIRARRKVLKISQAQIGAYVGVTFQQVQKWEKGKNRISAARLQMLCSLLEVPIEFFYDDDIPKDVLLPSEQRRVLDAYCLMSKSEKKFLLETIRLSQQQKS